MGGVPCESPDRSTQYPCCCSDAAAAAAHASPPPPLLSTAMLCSHPTTVLPPTRVGWLSPLLAVAAPEDMRAPPARLPRACPPVRLYICLPFACPPALSTERRAPAPASEAPASAPAPAPAPAAVTPPALPAAAVSKEEVLLLPPKISSRIVRLRVLRADSAAPTWLGSGLGSGS
eukprot:scaffold69304_cov63-Phaeocystis_antarctica.AAC.1